ncbi:hypothetical protein DERP_005016, partial [Dermatophagoides pteronyssinus]
MMTKSYVHRCSTTHLQSSIVVGSNNKNPKSRCEIILEMIFSLDDSFFSVYYICRKCPQIFIFNIRILDNNNNNNKI